MTRLSQPATPDCDVPQWDEDALWQRVLVRDKSSGDKSSGGESPAGAAAFVYGVRTTRTFCRASCPSRRPRRENVCFFASPQQASEAGFRACKRCYPQEPQSASIQAKRVRHACHVIEQSAGEMMPLEDLARAVGGSPFHLQRTFKQATGLTPREYADALRLEHLKAKLQEGQEITSALYDAGYGSSRALYERAPWQMGMTPATYGRGGAGACIIFATKPCSLGFLLVAATERGLCSVSLGDSEEELEAALRAEFPAADVRADEAELGDWLHLMLEILQGQELQEDLPLDVRATAFQWRVWRALRSIGAGQTRTYSQVAREIGQPSAARAVARACATNPLALLVPCHRVVREGGAIAGYRWGLERKKKLLQAEAEVKAEAEARNTDAST